MVNFRLPSVQTRKNLWNSLLPEKAPREADLDLDFLPGSLSCPEARLRKSSFRLPILQPDREGRLEMNR